MTAIALDEADDDLQRAFDYYELQRAGLGGELVHEFRRGVERILEFPSAWQRLDENISTQSASPISIWHRVSSGFHKQPNHDCLDHAPEPQAGILAATRTASVI